MAYDEDLADRIRVTLDDHDDVSEKRMFGGLAFLVGGHMALAAGGGGGLLLRCDPAHTETHAGEPGVSRCVMRGRELAGWLEVDADVVATDEGLARWADVGTAYAGSLPPK